VLKAAAESPERYSQAVSVWSRVWLAVCCVLTFEFTVAAGPNYGDTISGVAVNALAKAYESFDLGEDAVAPFRLESDVVVIEQWGTDFRVTTDEHSTGSHHEVVIDGMTAEPVSPAKDQPFRGMILLPGVIAGEIIATHRFLLKNPTVPQSSTMLESGAYNLSYSPAYKGGASLIFFAAKAPPTMADVKSAATPSPKPGLKCLAGACEGQFAYYIVRLRNGRVTFEPRAIL